jgi:hypothetical protein
MITVTSITHVAESDVLSRARRYGARVLEAISFESRSLRVPTILRDNEIEVTEATLLDYDTHAEPRDRDRELRQLHRAKCEGLLRSERTSIRKARVSPYSSNVLRRQMEDILCASSSELMVIDITCMTRVHLIVIAQLLARRRIDPENTVFAYVSPQSYNVEAGGSVGWRDTILVRISGEPSMRKEGHARGFILAGHDGDRLSVALSELEPSSGVVVFATNRRRPDLCLRARDANKAITERLLTLRMPRMKEVHQGKASERWQQVVVEMGDLEHLAERVLAEVAETRADEGPIVLFPFGPKIQTFVASCILAALETIDSWAVYPIPDGYPVNYSSGVAKTFWMKWAEVKARSGSSKRQTQ